MKTMFKWSGLFTLVICLVMTLVVPMSQTTAHAELVEQTSCDPPINIVKTEQTGTTVSYAWDLTGSMVTYDAWIVSQTSGLTVDAKTVSSPSVTLTGLTTGTYKVYFQTNCQGGGNSIIIEDDLIIH